jgi:hypothetical protein
MSDSTEMTPMHRNHPGYDAPDCHLRYTVTQVNPWGTVIRAGFGCEYTCGHCLPGESCARRREMMPVSLMSGAQQ